MPDQEPARTQPVGRLWETLPYESLPAEVYVLGGVMCVLGVVTLFLTFSNAFSNSYGSLFFYSIPANTAISPFPHEPVLFEYGKTFNIELIAIIATSGNLVAAYLDHRVFVPILNLERWIGYKQNRLYRKATDLFLRYPFTTLAFVSLTPIPFYPFKFLAFSVNYPLSLYLAAIAVSRVPRYWLLAWVGSAIQIPTWVLIAIVAGVFGAYGVRVCPAVWHRIVAKRAAHTALY